jgi:biotin carboxyl carrier protein
MKKLRVTVEGKVYEVLVEMLDEGRSVPSASPIPSTSTAVSSSSVAATVAAAGVPLTAPSQPGAGDVLSPLAGKVVSVDVALGQSVVEGSQVATVEAMKMNTYVYAPKSGKVAALLVNPGDAVDEGIALMRLA